MLQIAICIIKGLRVLRKSEKDFACIPGLKMIYH